MYHVNKVGSSTCDKDFILLKIRYGDPTSSVYDDFYCLCSMRSGPVLRLANRDRNNASLGGAI